MPLPLEMPFVGSCQERVEPGGCKVFPSGPENFGDSMGPKILRDMIQWLTQFKLILIVRPRSEPLGTTERHIHPPAMTFGNQRWQLEVPYGHGGFNGNINYQWEVLICHVCGPQVPAGPWITMTSRRAVTGAIVRFDCWESSPNGLVITVFFQVAELL